MKNSRSRLPRRASRSSNPEEEEQAIFRDATTTSNRNDGDDAATTTTTAVAVARNTTRHQPPPRLTVVASTTTTTRLDAGAAAPRPPRTRTLSSPLPAFRSTTARAGQVESNSSSSSSSRGRRSHGTMTPNRMRWAVGNRKTSDSSSATAATRTTTSTTSPPGTTKKSVSAAIFSVPSTTAATAQQAAQQQQQQQQFSHVFTPSPAQQRYLDNCTRKLFDALISRNFVRFFAEIIDKELEKCGASGSAGSGSSSSKSISVLLLRCKSRQQQHTQVQQFSRMLWQTDKYGSSCFHYAIYTMLPVQYHFAPVTRHGKGQHQQQSSDPDWWQSLLQLGVLATLAARMSSSKQLQMYEHQQLPPAVVAPIRGTMSDSDDYYSYHHHHYYDSFLTTTNIHQQTCFDVFFSSWLSPNSYDLHTHPIPGLPDFAAAMKFVTIDPESLSILRDWIHAIFNHGDATKAGTRNSVMIDRDDNNTADSRLYIVSRFWRAFELFCRAAAMTTTTRTTMQDSTNATTNTSSRRPRTVEDLVDYLLYNNNKNLFEQDHLLPQNFSLLHFMAQHLNNCPKVVVNLAVALYPEQVSQRQPPLHSLPLHLWAASTPQMVGSGRPFLEVLLREYPEGLEQFDAHGRYPLHIALAPTLDPHNACPHDKNNNNKLEFRLPYKLYRQIEQLWMKRPEFLLLQPDPLSGLYPFALVALLSSSTPDLSLLETSRTTMTTMTDTGKQRRQELDAYCLGNVYKILRANPAALAKSCRSTWKPQSFHVSTGYDASVTPVDKQSTTASHESTTLVSPSSTRPTLQDMDSRTVSPSPVKTSSNEATAGYSSEMIKRDTRLNCTSAVALPLTMSQKKYFNEHVRRVFAALMSRNYAEFQKLLDVELSKCREGAGTSGAMLGSPLLLCRNPQQQRQHIQQYSHVLWQTTKYGSSCFHYAIYTMVPVQYSYMPQQHCNEATTRVSLKTQKKDDWWQLLLQLGVVSTIAARMYKNEMKSFRDRNPTLMDPTTTATNEQESSSFFCASGGPTNVDDHDYDSFTTTTNIHHQTCFDVFFSSWFSPNNIDVVERPILGLDIFDASMQIVLADADRVSKLRQWIGQIFAVESMNQNGIVIDDKDDDPALFIVSRFWRAFELFCRAAAMTAEAWFSSVSATGTMTMEDLTDFLLYSKKSLIEQQQILMLDGFSLLHFMSQYVNNCPQLVANMAVALYPEQARQHKSPYRSFPLHLWAASTPKAIGNSDALFQALLKVYPDALEYPDASGQYVLHIALSPATAATRRETGFKTLKPFRQIELLWKARSSVLTIPDPATGLYPFAMVAAASSSSSDSSSLQLPSADNNTKDRNDKNVKLLDAYCLSNLYKILRADPVALLESCW